MTKTRNQHSLTRATLSICGRAKSHFTIRQFAGLSLAFLPAVVWAARAQAALQTIDMPQGGRIVYGTVEGADTQGAAMTAVLRNMHKNCGEKPQIGNVFEMRGTDSMGVFFTVVNHPAGNIPVAGLIIAAGSGTNKAEAALVSDSADRFGSTINPMLTKLFSVWHLGGQAATSGASTNGSLAPATGLGAGSNAAPAAPLHQVTLPDNTASVGIPDGWNLDPNSGGGTLVVRGPHGEVVALNLAYSALDPANPTVRQRQRSGTVGKMIVYPYNVDPVKAFPDIFQAIRRFNGLSPADLRIVRAEQLPAPEGQRSVHIIGQVIPDERGSCQMETAMSLSAPVAGMYRINVCSSVIPDAFVDQDRATVNAIFASFRLNVELLKQKMNRNMTDFTRRAVDHIHQIGRDAAARYAATDAANTAQHAAFNQRQDNISRNGQGFSNYLLDQTVIRDVEDPNTHAKVWNRTAEVLKRAYPDRIEEVPASQYIKGQDF
jgi:hypothetical protein